MGIKWTPWFNVPMNRRLELLSGMLVVFIGLALGPILSFMILYLLYAGNIYLRAICVLYLAFMYYDRHTPNRGGRGAGIAWVRGLAMFKYAMNYFPLDMVKTVDLPADRNYLVCLFPHGIFSMATYYNFNSSYSKWKDLFPGIRSKGITLGVNFLLPFVREFHLSCGASASSAKSISTLLNQSNDPNDKSNRDGYTANGVGLVVGGAKEAYYAFPNTYKCVLKERKGFVRIALKTGASLVPAISFGENSLYDIIEIKPDSWSRFILDKLKQFTTINPIPFNGRGLLQYNFGLLPKRVPITTVIGAPIHLEKNQHPTDEDIEKVHTLFCSKLVELFESHKHKYVDDYENVHFEIV